MPEKQTVILSLVEKTALEAVLSECEILQREVREAVHRYELADKRRMRVTGDILMTHGYAPDDEVEINPKDLVEGSLVRMKRRERPAAGKQEEQKADGPKVEAVAG